MATFSATNSVDFTSSLSVLAILGDPATFSNKTANGFTATSSGTFAHVIEVIGTNFDYAPTVTGMINSLVIKPPFFGTAYTITGLTLSYIEIATALSTSIEEVLAKIFRNADVISGSGFDDHLFGYEHSDEIHAGAGNDILDGGDDGDHLFGGAGDDELFGGSHSDHLFGGEGNDVLNGGSTGLDKLDGGAGLDSADYSDEAVSVSVALNGGADATVFVGGVAEDTIRNVENLAGGSGNDSLTGDALTNVLIGNAGDDTLDGAGGDDSLFGGVGDDRLYGGAGADVMQGGTGNDTYFVDDLGDAVTELADGGGDFVASTITYTLGENVEALALFFTDAAIDGTGNALDNLIFGNDAANTIDGRGGADTMAGGLGDDTYIIDNVGDKIDEAPGEGTELVHAAMTFALSANVENLILAGVESIGGTGNELANAITGNSGNNALVGGLGDDMLAGGLGLDVLTGGEGSDTFLFDATLNKKANVDTITDFAAGLDRIGLDADIFKKVNDSGTLKKKFFADGKADDGNDYVIYKEKSGTLFYDKDGDGDKFGKVKFATLSGAPDMDSADFFVV